ncbi:hypothetical protein F8M41_004463 [Gigaspora margarita]|uniref:Uncharacterized protein n=1 Tax=Gigaspora margarita TaxID=4874 RepID=A0A8H4A7N3_GIGMA|nr:hypothetical protein F8M41_004463 [Gigaspora margarita]
MTKKNGSLNRSYAFDPEDRYVQSGFIQDELMEIVEMTTSSQELQIKEDLLHYINTFVKVNEYIGGEKAGIASSDRKNQNRVLSSINKCKEKALKRKGYEFESTITDWATSEGSHKWDGEKGTKLLKECGLSLPKTLKDIFISLSRKINFCEKKFAKLGSQGAVLIKIILDCLNGYVCRITRDSLLEIYTDVTQFNKTLDALISIIYAKLEIIKSMEVVNGAFSNDDNVNR